MKALRLLSLIIALTLLGILAVAAGAQEGTTLSNGGCTSAAGYDPACDVDHNGVIDVNYLQQATGHWNEGRTHCVRPPVGMVSWWDGDSVFGTTARDIRGFNHGTLQNGTTVAPGLVGRAFTLDGIDDQLEILDDPSLDLRMEFTIEAWFNTRDVSRIDPGTGLPIQTIVMYGFDPDGGKNNPMHIKKEHLAFVVRGYGPHYDDLEGSTSVVNDQWYHAAVTYDGKYARIYLNGVLEDAKPVVMDMDANSKVLIGRYQNPAYYNQNYAFFGAIDEVAIYNRALCQDEVQAIYWAGSAGKCKPADYAPVVDR
jgi:hypothetical protein